VAGSAADVAQTSYAAGHPRGPGVAAKISGGLSHGAIVGISSTGCPLSGLDGSFTVGKTRDALKARKSSINSRIPTFSDHKIVESAACKVTYRRGLSKPPGVAPGVSGCLSRSRAQRVLITTAESKGSCRITKGRQQRSRACTCGFGSIGYGSSSSLSMA